ncbi:TatD family hydrolase [Candidatus Saccharibacteria bacterium]|nr:TatD family hydrolase [Candidatus Saccharibacteria bacterium]
MNSLTDAHCHLHDREFFSNEQAEEMVKRAKEAGVNKIICIGTSREDSLAARDFAITHENVYWTYGIHPSNATSLSQRRGVRRLASRGVAPAARGARPLGRELPKANGPAGRAPERDKLVAIGEVGLDYHYDGYDREAQIKLFEEMLQLAMDNNLPVSFHVREAFNDFFAVVANFPKVRGVVHSFTDSKKVLKRILNETEFYVGVNGLATYSTLPTPPLERIILETDAPFLAPVPFRGKINEPAFIREIAEWLSAKLDTSFDIVSQQTTKNAEELFNLSK